jgi:hypothetical protein
VSTVADDDTMAGFVAAWKATPFLAAAFPAGPVAGRIPSPQPNPYVGIACEQWQPPEYVGTVAPGQTYLDYRKVTLTVRGAKALVVELLSRVKLVYGNRVPAGLAIPNAQRVRWVEPLDEDRLEEDGARKQGEDIWKGVATYGVSTQRTVL